MVRMCRSGMVVALLTYHALWVGQMSMCLAEEAVLYVAPDGSDAWSGRLPEPNQVRTDGPFASLERARDEIRRIKAAGPLPKGGMTVTMRGGRYKRRDTLKLTTQDSGRPDAEIVYCAYRRESVRITGGKVIGGFRTVTDPDVLSRLAPAARGHVVFTDLPKQRVSDFGAIGTRRHQKPIAGVELFFKDRPMTLARWPNKGWARVAGAPNGERGGRFAYDEDRPRRWLDEQDPRACGFWAHDWAASHVALASIDTDEKVITTRPPHSVYGYRKGKRFFAYNLLCELDEPGEWYLDRSNGVLYFWPPERLTPGSVVVSVCGDLVSMHEVSHVTFRGLTFEAGRGGAVIMRGGTGNAIIGCTIRNIGKKAAVLSQGVGHRVVGCDIYDTGEGGMLCIGGDKKTLTPCEFVIENNVITRCSRWQLTHSNAVSLYTVGARVAHNLMHDIPHQALYFSGNDNVIEYNELHSIGYEAGELGAVYAGRDWTLCGNVVRFNYFHDIYNPCRQRNRGIMLDDGAAGIEMYGNLFVRVAEGISLSSINNRVANNVFVQCRPAIACWGGAARFPEFSLDHSHYKTMWPRLVGLALDRPPWSKRYPELAGLRDAIKNGEVVPEKLRGHIERNIFWDAAECIGFHRTPKEHCWVIRDNLRDRDPLFAGPAKGDYRVRRESPAFALGFKPIPVDRIGVYQHDCRASWPVKHEVRRDLTRNLMYVPPPKKPRGPAPMFSVPRASTQIKIDGAIGKSEWQGTPMVVQYDVHGGKTNRTSRAWFAYDDAALYIAVQNKVSARPPLKIGSKWGTDDAVEIAVRNSAAGESASILVFRGYVSGEFESSIEAGATAEQAKAASVRVAYAAQVADSERGHPAPRSTSGRQPMMRGAGSPRSGRGRPPPKYWTAEWRIPFASLGIDPAQQRKLAFNLTVRKTADSLWLMWVPTGSHSWRVDLAGYLELTPRR